MKLSVYFLLLIAVLGLSSCDRFEHAFQPVEEVDFATELFTPLQGGFDASLATNLAPAMAFYAEDYLQFGVNKSEWEAMLASYISGVETPVFAVTFGSTSMLSETEALANWRLVITDPSSKLVIADSSFVGERLVKRNGQWLLKGNQMTCNPPAAKQRVIVEYVTNIGCSYCPAVEDKLHELYATYPNQFIYLTHQLSGPVMISDPLYAYYNAFSAPTSLIQGQYKLSSGTQDILDQYAPLVDNLVTIDSPMTYNVVSTLVAGNNVSGSVKLTPAQTGFSQSELVLNLAIMEKVSTATSVSGEHLTNVVLGRTRIDLSSVNLANPIEFNFTANVSIPDDAALVIFAQRTPATFANNAFIYSGLEVPLGR